MPLLLHRPSRPHHGSTAAMQPALISCGASCEVENQGFQAAEPGFLADVDCCLDFATCVLISARALPKPQYPEPCKKRPKPRRPNRDCPNCCHFECKGSKRQKSPKPQDPQHLSDQRRPRGAVRHDEGVVWRRRCRWEPLQITFS